MIIKVIEKCVDKKYYWDLSKAHITEVHEVEGESLDECFKKAYPFERSLRYCNGYWIEFETEDLNKKYKEWKKTGVDIAMYYGNGVVD